MKRNPGSHDTNRRGWHPARRWISELVDAGGRSWSDLQVRFSQKFPAEIHRSSLPFGRGAAPPAPPATSFWGRARRTSRIFHLAGANFMVFFPPQKRKSRGRAEGNPPPASGLTKYLRDLKVHTACPGRAGRRASEGRNPAPNRQNPGIGARNVSVAQARAPFSARNPEI